MHFLICELSVHVAGFHKLKKTAIENLLCCRHHMPPTLEGQVTMEKTPSYFVTREVPQRVHQMNPNTKLLIVVRDPVTRAISDYTQAAR